MYRYDDLKQGNARTPYPVLDDIRMDRALSSGPNQEQSNGFINISEDYSVGETIFKVHPKSIDEVYEIFRIQIYIKDFGKFNSGNYGNNITLANGITLRIVGDSFADITLTFVPIRLTLDWQIYCYDFTYSDFGVGDNIAACRWTFDKGGRPLSLKGWDNQRLECVLSDDLSGLEAQYVYAQGLFFDRNFTEV